MTRNQRSAIKVIETVVRAAYQVVDTALLMAGKPVDRAKAKAIHRQFKKRLKKFAFTSPSPLPGQSS